MKHKITRIFLKVLGISILFISTISVFLYFSIQSYSFQTWLGKKTSNYLSSELKTTISINTIKLDFFRSALLKDILILDKHKDTLFYGEIEVNINDFNFKKNKITLEKIKIKNATTKIINYKNDSSMNYQFLIDYFKTENINKSKNKAWQIKYGKLDFENVSFVYRYENRNTTLSKNINFDHLVLKKIYGSISNLKIDKDIQSVTINDIKTKEQSGFELNELTTQLKITDKNINFKKLCLQTSKTLVKGDINLNFIKFEDFDDFSNKVFINTNLKNNTHVNTSDLAFFTSELNGLNENIFIAGDFLGKINNFNFKNMKLGYGKFTKIEGDIKIIDMTEPSKCFIDLFAKKITINYSDLDKIPMYPFFENKKIDLPIELKKIGTVNFKGSYIGLINDFKIKGNINTLLGNIETDLNIKNSDNLDNITYEGEINTVDLNIGEIINQPGINELTTKFKIKGKSLKTNTILLNLTGELNKIKIKDYTYKNIKLNGNMSDKLFIGFVESKDTNANFVFNGVINLKDKIPELNFVTTLYNLELNKLKLISKIDSGSISSKIRINIKGDNLENLTGEINLENTRYNLGNKKYFLKTLDIVAKEIESKKNIKLTSEYLNAEISGDYKYKNLQLNFESILYKYYPTYFKKPISDNQFNDNIKIKVEVKKFKIINELLIKDLMLSNNTKLEADFTSIDDKLTLRFNSSEFSYKNFLINDLVFSLKENNNEVIADVKSKSLNISDSISLENFNLNLKSVDKKTNYLINWFNNNKPLNDGVIEGKIIFNDSNLTINSEKINIRIKDSLWQLQSPSDLTIEKNGDLFVNQFNIINNEQIINIDGKLSNKINNFLTINMKKIKLYQFNPLLKIWDFKINGNLNSHILLSKINNQFLFEGDLQLKQLIINDNEMGDFNIASKNEALQKYITLNGYSSLGEKNESGEDLKNLTFDGVYDLNKNEESIDINFEVKPLNVKILNPFLEDIITIKKGYINGKGKIHGTPKNILFDSKLKIFNSEIKVDYTNVNYIVTGDIEIMKDQIRFSELLLREKGTKSVPQGTLNGNIFHNNFNNIKIDYDISYKNMLILNTSEKENTTFYGKTYGTGNMSIYGYLDDLNMDIQNTTDKNSKIILPLDGPSEIEENKFIHFITKDTSGSKKVDQTTGFNFYLDLNITPDASAEIILDSKNGDVITSKGNGNIKFKINTLGKFEMIGKYTITEGNYVFNLENIINKKFDIEKGSTILWSGNPLDADIDVITNYKQRASIAPLINDSSFKSRFLSECKLLISGKLFAPNIKFAIEFPTIDATSKARINNILADEGELNRQVFSFLLFRTFVTPQIFNTNTGGVSAGNAAASAGSEMLSNRLSELLNSSFGNFTGLSNLQMGLNYRPSNENNNEAIDLALSKQFLNDKITVDGNFGVNKNNVNSNGIIGDVNIDYKLSDDGKYRLKGFNRSNDNTQIATNGGSYTQGIGIYYKEDFETFNQLFSSYLKKIKKRKNLTN